MIEISNLTKTYRGNIYALRDVSLTIGSGMFGLVGPNGAGKTSLMRILAGLLQPTSGTVRIFGHDITTQAGKYAVKMQLGYLPQELGFYPNLTAVEFLDYIAILKGIAVRRPQIEALLDLVRLTDVATRRIKTYSGGMKRRLGIAQALLGDPKLIIVDEPTAGLDPEERVRLRNMLADAARQRTIILSTHIIEDISQSCKDLAMLSKGRLVFQGSPRTLITQAEGHVWQVTTYDERPEGVTVVSTLQLADGMQYRVIGQPPAHYEAQPAAPTLEDGYMWQMQQVNLK